MGKGIEMAFLKTVLVLLKDMGVKAVRAHYFPTAKNAQVRDFYERCGFSFVVGDGSGRKEYVLDIDNAELGIKEYYHINVK